MSFNEMWDQIKKEVEVAVKCFDSDRRLYIIYNTTSKSIRTYWYKKQEKDVAVLKKLFDDGVLKTDDYVIYNSYTDDNICSSKEYAQKSNLEKIYDQFCEENMQRIYEICKKAVKILNKN